MANLRNIYDSRRIWKVVFLILSLVLVALFLYISNNLVKDLAEQERERMEIWADATRELVTGTSFDMDADGNPIGSGGTDVDFLLRIIEANHNIPVLLVDDKDNILDHRNFRLPDPSDAPLQDSPVNLEYLNNKLRHLKHSENKIEIEIDKDTTQYLYYEDSTLLRRLAYFPYILLAVLVLFFAIAYFALTSIKRAEQNKVWVGLSKETAHQLGTPISSLMAWSTVLKEAYPDDELLPEMEKDVKRLERIAERFSKIGSVPEPKPEDVCEIMNRVVDYMDRRTSNKVKITCHVPEEPVIVNLVASLFEWVGENLCKNAVDAMAGTGKIDIFVKEKQNQVDIEFVDTGKGIPKNNFKTVFKPGFTTKERGWGLGLSLAKRIIEEYHNGKIFVKSSEIGVGTTFKIELPK